MITWDNTEFDGHQMLVHHASHGDWSIKVAGSTVFKKGVTLMYGPAYRRLRLDGSIQPRRVGRFSSRMEAELAVDMYEDLDADIPTAEETHSALGLESPAFQMMAHDGSSRKFSICNAEKMVSLLITHPHNHRPLPVAFMDQRIALPSETLQPGSRLSDRPRTLSYRQIRWIDNAIMGEIIKIRLFRSSETGRGITHSTNAAELEAWRRARGGTLSDRQPLARLGSIRSKVHNTSTALMPRAMALG